MNDIKLNEYLNEFGKAYSPDPSRELIDSIMAIPREVEQNQFISWNFGQWFMFIVPRLSGLTAACILGLYLGGASDSALAEDELAALGFNTVITEQTEIVETELLDVEDFIFVEDVAQ